MANNPASRWIGAKQLELRRRIRAVPVLKKDFDFLTQETGYSPELLLGRLFWDCDLMHADLQTVLAETKKEFWPMKKKALRRVIGNAYALAARTEEVNKTEFSPARTAIFRGGDDVQLTPKESRNLRSAFADLPEILRLYAGSLRRKIFVTTRFWPPAEKDTRTMVEDRRRASLYELIRSSTGKYHATRLHRLVSAAREVQGLPQVEQRAFIIWLNRLRKRQTGQRTPSPAGNHAHN